MLWVLLALPVLAAGACAALAWLLCGRQSPSAPPDPAASAELQRWLDARVTVRIEVESDDGLPLRALFVPRKNPRGTVLLFHDRCASCVSDYPGTAQFLYETGFQLILTDGRAHGKSKGRWCSYGLWERFDARAWCQYCSMRFPDGHPLFLFGQGLGGAAVLGAAGLELPGNVRGVVSEGAFTSPREFLERVLNATPLPPGAALRMANAAIRALTGFSLYDPGAEDRVRDAAYPALFIHGTADTVVPPDMARRLFSACASEKQLLMVEGGTHTRCRNAAPEEYDQTLGFFLDAYLRHG
ncbi:MAG: alpha/beta hydrolase [Oscillospiraceae bacterium]|nr:alpha/beta hydrolase [Oscillospiraceae bacterium]